MDVDKVEVRPLDAAGEDELAQYRLQHPDTAIRQLSSLYHLSPEPPAELPETLRAGYVDAVLSKSDLLDLEKVRYLQSLRKFHAAKDVQERQLAIYEGHMRILRQRIEEEIQEIRDEKARLEAAKQKKESYKTCDDMSKELRGRPKKRAELEELITRVQAELHKEEQLKTAYEQEAENRRKAFTSIRQTVDEFMHRERVEPSRSAADLPKLNANTSKLTALSSASEKKSQTHLDPKAASFTPLNVGTAQNDSSQAATGSSNVPAQRHNRSGLPENRAVSAAKANGRPNSGSAGPSRNGSRSSTPMRDSPSVDQSSIPEKRSNQVEQLNTRQEFSAPKDYLSAGSAAFDDSLKPSTATKGETHRSGTGELLAQAKTRPTIVRSPLAGAHSSPAVPQYKSATNAQQDQGISQDKSHAATADRTKFEEKINESVDLDLKSSPTVTGKRQRDDAPPKRAAGRSEPEATGAPIEPVDSETTSGAEERGDMKSTGVSPETGVDEIPSGEASNSRGQRRSKRVKTDN